MRLLIYLSFLFAHSSLADNASLLPPPDETHLIGRFSFKKKYPPQKVVKIAETLKTHFPNYEHLLILKDGEESYGIQFSYKNEPRQSAKEFGEKTRNFISDNFEYSPLKSWSISSQVTWIKKPNELKTVQF